MRPGSGGRHEATAACLGLRLESSGRWRVYAPHGLADVFNLVVRPNPVLSPRGVYLAKTSRWRGQWPELTVLPWPEIRPADHGEEHRPAARITLTGSQPTRPGSPARRESGPSP
ncbi:MAG TPA: nucleotidyltransferase family protein [Streptosporangiaceae bacterium]